MFFVLHYVGILLSVGCGAVHTLPNARPLGFSYNTGTEFEKLKRLPNTRYLGMGYNVIKGNPDSDLYDPGFAFGVLEFTWINSVPTSDRKYKVPDHVQGLETKSCGFQSHVSTEFGSRSYQNALSIDVSVEVGGRSGIWNARFTASAGYKKVNEGTNQRHRIYIAARAKCIQYTLSVNHLHAPIGVTSLFAQAVSSLPLTRDDSAYNAFIDAYGTHFTSRVTIGAKMVIRSEFDETSLMRMEDMEINLENGAKSSFLEAASGKSGSNESQTFEEMRKSYSTSYLGIHPPSSSRWDSSKSEAWAKKAAESPYPVSYKLAPLTSLLTSKFFPNMPASLLATRRNLLNAAYDIYCSNISGCGIPPPDLVPVRMMSAVSRFLGSTRVFCPANYKLLSCGTVNVRMSGSHDKQRYAIPADANSCECYDNSKAKCASWCSNAVDGFTTAASPLVRGNTTVSCPAGYKVLIHTDDGISSHFTSCLHT